MKPLPILLVASLVTSVAWGKDAETTDDVDHLAIATMLLQDGYPERALTVFQQVSLDPSDESAASEHAEHFRILGLVYLRLEKFSEAATAFATSIERGDGLSRTRLLLARALMRSKKPARALEVLHAHRALLAGAPDAVLLRAEAHWRLERPHQALLDLEVGRGQFPQHSLIRLQHLLMLTKVGLYQAATEQALTIVRSGDAEESELLAISEALRLGGQTQEAAAILEGALVQNPLSEEMRKQLANIYLAGELPRSAADVLRGAPVPSSETLTAAAELYRRVGAYHSALTVNAGVDDQVEKLSQRLAILIEQERFDDVVSLRPRLSRLGLLKRDDIRYAVAYAHFQTADYPAAQKLLSWVRSGPLFDKAVALREVIDRCRNNPGECL